MPPLARAPLLSRFGARARDGGNSLPLPFAIAVSLLLHGVILSITFTVSEPPPRQEVRQLDVVLVNARREKPPKEADVLAQANLDGGGNSNAEDARPSTPTPRRQEIERGDALADARRAAPPPAPPPPQPEVKLETTPPAPQPEPEPEPEPAPEPPPLPEPPAPAPQPEPPPPVRALPEPTPEPLPTPKPESERRQFTFDSPEPLRDEPPPPPPPPVLTAIERPVITPVPPRPALPEPRVEPQLPPAAAPAPAPLPEPPKPAAPPPPEPAPAPEPRPKPQPIPAPKPEPAPAPAPEPQPQPQRSLPSGADLMNSVAAIARLEAQIDRRLDEFSKRPRKVQIGSRAREHRFAQYAEDWRQKVERIGTLNYPDAARGKLYGTLVLTVAIRADGTVERIDVDRSSGHEVLDRAAIDIVRLAAPYAPFPPDIRVDTDIVEITRTWSFTNSDQLRTR